MAVRFTFNHPVVVGIQNALVVPNNNDNIPFCKRAAIGDRCNNIFTSARWTILKQGILVVWNLLHFGRNKFRKYPPCKRRGRDVFGVQRWQYEALRFTRPDTIETIVFGTAFIAPRYEYDIVGIEGMGVTSADNSLLPLLYAFNRVLSCNQCRFNFQSVPQRVAQYHVPFGAHRPVPFRNVGGRRISERGAPIHDQRPLHTQAWKTARPGRDIVQVTRR